MRVLTLVVQLDDEPSRRDAKVAEAAMRVTERRLLDGRDPRFFVGTRRAKKIARAVDLRANDDGKLWRRR